MYMYLSTLSQLLSLSKEEEEEEEEKEEEEHLSTKHWTLQSQALCAAHQPILPERLQGA